MLEKLSLITEVTFMLDSVTNSIGEFIYDVEVA